VVMIHRYFVGHIIINMQFQVFEHCIHVQIFGFAILSKVEL